MRVFRRCLALLLLFANLLSADLDSFFDEGGDPTLYHHVNVITGNLNLSMLDYQVPAPGPFAIQRSYSSAGVKEMYTFSDLPYGWSLFPHTKIQIQKDKSKSGMSFYLAHKSGSVIQYVYSHKESRHVHIYKPKKNKFRCAGEMGARTNPDNTRISVNFYHKKAIVHFPDGSFVDYKVNNPDFENHNIETYLINKEVLSNGHTIRYTFNKYEELKEITYCSPTGDTLASIRKNLRQSDPYKFTLTTSDENVFTYQASSHKKGDYYLHTVTGGGLPAETIYYGEDPATKKARITRIEREGKILFDATYYPTKKKDKESLPRVWVIKSPTSDPATLTPIATFNYEDNYTDVRDVHHILTRFRHEDDHLTEIEYFDENDILASVIKYIWRDSHLQAKVKLDSHREPLFAKTFTYDDTGNVLQETFWGNLTGEAPGPYTLNSDGSLQGAESTYRRYQYLPRFNVPTLEEEEGGLTTYTTYKEDTNLPISKLVYFGKSLLKRTLCTYDEDNFLIEETVDDGTSTETHIKRITYDKKTGLPCTITELTPDHLLTKKHLAYDTHRRLAAETIFDAQDTERYTLYYTYDSHGNITSTTNSIGQKSTYTYDPLGKLLYAHEVGKPSKTCTYDPMGYLISSTEVDTLGTTKTTTATYDEKGRLLSQTDPLGNQITQEFNAFGQCLKSHLSQDSEIPITYTYDSLGNIASTTNPAGNTSHTTYTTLRKPLLITHPDGTQTKHTYTKDGQLKTTTHPDGATITYTYDPLRRKTSERVFASDGTLLQEETWHYSALHLLSHTDPRGLTTTYTYDSAGRKIAEQALDRITTYTYDPLGFLETTTTPTHTHIETHDTLGRVLAQWDLLQDGIIENHITFEYDQNNRKCRAIRRTPQGLAEDTFVHDGEGRLRAHTDPEGNTTTIDYIEEITTQKITTDPLGNRTLETYDTFGHLLTLERQNPDEETVSFETSTYDLAGNRTSRTSTLYQDTQPIKTVTVTWTYDTMGRVTSETEADQKTTTYTYDPRGRLHQKILPDGTTLTHTYDCLGRLLTQASSDGTIDTHFTYDCGPDPTLLYDAVHDLTLSRAYNSFGELISEINPYSLETTWTYDTAGRPTTITLPAHTAITYTYDGPHLSAATLQTPTHTATHYYTEFDPNGHVTQEELINGLGTLTTTHDILERPTTQISPYHTHTTHYGPSGLVTQTQNTIQGDKDYTYDPLNQLLTAGPDTYHFDSFGNPIDAITDDLNQLLSTYTYDPCGNPTSRSTPQTTYTYDALGRLLTLNTTTFTYDPLGRLIKTTTPTETHLHLYDQERDIGTLAPDHTIKHLRLLGLGIKGDIGATLAILLDNTLYAPLHDTQGNIIALIAPDHTVAETYHYTPFGYEANPTSNNPYRFASKRTLKGLIYFGLRFYDPSTGRFLTPDPAGFTDSPNLYLYTLNSPLNRLDLFGLSSELNPFPQLILPIPDTPDLSTFIQGKLNTAFASTDVLVFSSFLHKLNFTPEEIKAHAFNLFNHLAELFPSEGSQIGLVTFHNGINTNLAELKANFQGIIDKIPEGTLSIAIHHATQGALIDGIRVYRELVQHNMNKLFDNHSADTPIISHYQQIYTALATNLKKINPSTMWLHIAHSAGTLDFTHIFQGLDPETKAYFRSNLDYLAFAPASPGPLNYGHSVTNYYSDHDHFTYFLGRAFLNDPNYDIRFLPCTSSRSDRTLGLFDHGFLSPTQQGTLGDRIQGLRVQKGFYDGKVR